MAMLKMMGKKSGSYMNEDVVENVIRYITRTRENELIAWGGMGVGCYGSPELAIEQFCCVQQVYGISARGGRRIYHEVLGFTDEEFERMWRNFDLVYQIAVDCAKRYYDAGHQVVFAIHYVPKEVQNGNSGVHIHFEVNAVSFMTGRKWHSYIGQSFDREQSFNQNMRDEINRELIEPLELYDFFNH